jgi:hypothetical protein
MPTRWTTSPDEDMPAVAKGLARGGRGGPERRRVGFRRRTGKPESEHRGHRPDGHRRPVPGRYRRVLCCRRALTRGRAGVGCQERRRLSLPRKKSGSSCPTRPWGTNRARRPSRLGDRSHMCLDRMPAVGFAGVCNRRADQARSLSTVVAVRPAVGHWARNGTASALAA